MPETSARDGDRDAAAKLVEAAFAGGQIISLDRDKRLEQVKSAQTLGELDMIVHDLPGWASAGSAASARAATAPAGPPPPDSLTPSYPPTPSYLGVPAAAEGLSPQAEAELLAGLGGGARRRSPLLLLIPMVLVIAVVGGVLAIFLTSAADKVALPDLPDFEPSRPAAPLAALSVEGYQDMVGDLVAETGSSVVFEAVMYDEYAVLSVPVDPTGDHQESYRWDGDLVSTGSFSASRYDRLDLNTIDPAVVVRLAERARTRLVEDPTAVYVIVRSDPNDEGTFAAYASNKFNEGGYLSATKDGKVIRKVTW